MKLSIGILLVIMIAACAERTESSLDLFSAIPTTAISENNFDIDENLLGRAEGIQCNDSSLLVFDVHSGDCFSLFNLNTMELIGRFGRIGEGPDEILQGTYGYLNGNKFNVFYDATGLIAQYNVDSLYQNNAKLKILTKYQIPDASFSRVIPLNDSVFFGTGTYQQTYQYAVFNNKSKVLDYAVDIFNAKEPEFDIYHLFLSNQGLLKKHPVSEKFVYSLNYSSNIDFISIENSKIHLIKSMHLKPPKFTAQQTELYSMVIPDSDNVLGYLDLATGEKYVYALYTDKKLAVDGKGNGRSSKIVLVYDWEGNPIRKYSLQEEAYHITVNEKSNKLYTVIRNAEDGWAIKSYNLTN